MKHDLYDTVDRGGPSYQYVIVTDPQTMIQYDWALFEREGYELIYGGRRLVLPRTWIGRKVIDVHLTALQYFMRPR